MPPPKPKEYFVICLVTIFSIVMCVYHAYGHALSPESILTAIVVAVVVAPLAVYFRPPDDDPIWN